MTFAPYVRREQDLFADSPEVDRFRQDLIEGTRPEPLPVGIYFVEVMPQRFAHVTETGEVVSCVDFTKHYAAFGLHEKTEVRRSMLVRDITAIGYSSTEAEKYADNFIETQSNIAVYHPRIR